MFIQQTGVTAIIATSIINLITYVIIITITQDCIMDIDQIDKTWWWGRLKQQIWVVFSAVLSAW